ncbi:MAG: hypothetical protein WAU69_08410 [Solirubrobacteraceae bacterium]
MRRVVALLLIGAAALGVVGCGGSTGKHAEREKTTAASASATETALACIHVIQGWDATYEATHEAMVASTNRTLWEKAITKMAEEEAAVKQVPSLASVAKALERERELYGALAADYVGDAGIRGQDRVEEGWAALDAQLEADTPARQKGELQRAC